MGDTRGPKVEVRAEMGGNPVTASSRAPKVFAQYTHDSPAHKERVLALADRLRGDGVGAMVDQYIENPPEGWPTWMDAQLRSSHYVLVICTEANCRRFRKQEEPGRGLGPPGRGISYSNTCTKPAR